MLIMVGARMRMGMGIGKDHHGDWDRDEDEDDDEDDKGAAGWWMLVCAIPLSPRRRSHSPTDQPRLMDERTDPPTDPSSD